MARISQLSAILILMAGFVLAQTDNSQPSTDTPKDQNPSSQASNSTSENEKPKPSKKARKAKKHDSGQNAVHKGTGTTQHDRGKGTTGETGESPHSDQEHPSQNPPPTPPPQM